MRGRGAAAAVAEDEDEFLVFPSLVNQVGPGLDFQRIHALQFRLEPLHVLIDA